MYRPNMPNLKAVKKIRFSKKQIRLYTKLCNDWKQRSYLKVTQSRTQQQVKSAVEREKPLDAGVFIGVPAAITHLYSI